mmetsp:Transcript_6798/g.20417  ORF Transcript_6798/g.20417 Transcript_6798/m.20417 type:complete len:200 (-) Transcript_6798:1314-1913(-)
MTPSGTSPSRAWRPSSWCPSPSSASTSRRWRRSTWSTGRSRRRAESRAGGESPRSGATRSSSTTSPLPRSRPCLTWTSTRPRRQEAARARWKTRRQLRRSCRGNRGWSPWEAWMPCWRPTTVTGSSCPCLTSPWGSGSGGGRGPRSFGTAGSPCRRWRRSWPSRSSRERPRSCWSRGTYGKVWVFFACELGMCYIFFFR